MALIIKASFKITDKFRDLIKRQKYEEYVLLILNRSRIIMGDKRFERKKDQSHGECDYEDDYGNKYDAKLLIHETQGRLLGERKNEIEKYLNDIQKEEEVFYNYIAEENLDNIHDIRLSQVMYERLLSLNSDENAVFFMPFPMVSDFEVSYTMSGTMDYIDVSFTELEDDKLVKEREIYFIYPSMDGKWVLRDKQHNREFIEMPELDAIIKVNTCEVIFD